MKIVAALLVLAITTTSCSEEPKADEGGLSGTCGLRKIAPNVDESLVGEEFLLNGVEIAKTQNLKDRFIATINAPYGVDEAYRLYQDQIKDAGWDVVTQETEGFEAEIYLSNEQELAAIQIRTSTCDRKVVVYVSIIDRVDPGAGN